MNKSSIPYIIILVLLAIIFLMRQCDDDSEAKTFKVVVPEVKGSFKDDVKPEQTPINIDSIAQLIKDTLSPKIKIIKQASEKNDSLLNAYLDLKDKYDRYEMFEDFIQVKEFSKTFEDEYLKAEITGINRGDIESMFLDYTIKERQMEVQNKETILRALIGLEFGNNTEFSDMRYALNFAIQNRKGNIFELEYEKYQNLDYFMLGYKQQLFKIRK